MQSNDHIVKSLILGCFENTVKAPPLKPFDGIVLDFFNDLSKCLTGVREYSEVASFGFWCRKAALVKEAEKYDDLGERLGRGVAFHSTPSNVPVNFAFSFAAGLLAGNANIVRLPGKDFKQVDIIVDAIRGLLSGAYTELAPYVCFVKYPPDRALHDLYSSVCDVRIIWGGDNTIKELRESPLKPRAKELTFSDRYSIAVIDADAYLRAGDKSRIAQDFYNDTYFTDQNACTSPRIIFWLGDNVKQAKKHFWNYLHALVKEKYDLAPVQAVGKLFAFYRVAASWGRGTVLLHQPCFSKSGAEEPSPCPTRIEVTGADSELMQYKYNSGFFFEQNIKTLNEILPICGEQLQTLTYYGLTQDEITAFINDNKPKGIDRAVPAGRSMDFALTWDGYDLIREMSRKVDIR